MAIRVPLLLQKSVAVIHRLDVSATRAHDPVGPSTIGYDEVLREPIAYSDGGSRIDSRREMDPIRVPCQVENLTDEQLKMELAGDVPISNTILIFHRADLERLNLLDNERNVIIKKGDRVEKLERFGAPLGTVMKSFSAPGLYIHEMRSRSWGFGPDGHDLELALFVARKDGAHN